MGFCELEFGGVAGLGEEVDDPAATDTPPDAAIGAPRSDGCADIAEELGAAYEREGGEVVAAVDEASESSGILVTLTAGLPPPSSVPLDEERSRVWGVNGSMSA